MSRSPWLFLDIPEDFYDYAHAYMVLNIDDDIGPDIQTLTTIWTQLRQDGDIEGANSVLKKIMAKQGKNYDAIVPRSRGVKPVNPNRPGEVPSAPANNTAAAAAPEAAAEAAQ